MKLATLAFPNEVILRPVAETLGSLLPTDQDAEAFRPGRWCRCRRARSAAAGPYQC